MLESGSSQGGAPSTGPGAALPRTFGAYELLEEVARGGMGVVYRARQTHVNRLVAVKVLASGVFAAPDFVKRFRTEAEAVASLDHPHIVPIYDVGECEGQPYFSMKFVESGTLADRISRAKSPIANREAAALLAKLAHAVHFAHQRGILHRDIKPGNVLMDAQGEPLLTDFGLAKLVEKESTLTRTMAMLGTPSYMSPEQARGEAKQLTTAVDVYGLGAVFYELLTGQAPFAGGTTMETVRQVLEKEPRRPSTLQPGLDLDLETICLKCLEKDAGRRYGSAESLADDLERWLHHEPILARPTSAWEHTTKWIRRNRLAFMAMTAIALLLVTGVTVSTWQRLEAQSAQKIAETERQRAETNVTKFKTASIQSRRSQYAADMFAATAKMEKGSYGTARNFLREYFPREGLEELRGFEWRYWWQLSAGQQLDTFPISDQVLDMAWSPDGRLIAEGNSDGTFKLLHADSGVAVFTLTGSSKQLVSVAFSFDGRGLATAGDDGRACFWNVSDGRLIFTLTNRSPRVACSPTGKL
ncbi:MAG TPA: serine/threonine-protein kinase, partial [Verrucomicrobiae bacterium]|nr:serine/threonine-protein kinase [Verrucomicrobiae bacterium]